MVISLDEIVVTEGNQRAFDAILSIGRTEGEPRKLFIWGPKGSGKSTVASARGREKDLLSTRRIISCHAQEILAIIKSGINDEFLNEIGEEGILLLDGFDTLFDGDEIGSELGKLLLQERNRNGLSTVVISDMALEHLDTTLLDGVLDDYEQIEVQPLDAAGLQEFAEKIYVSLRNHNDAAPVIAPDALTYIALEFAQEPKDIQNALTFLLTKEGDQTESTLTKDVVKTLLGV